MGSYEGFQAGDFKHCSRSLHEIHFEAKSLQRWSPVTPCLSMRAGCSPCQEVGSPFLLESWPALWFTFSCRIWQKWCLPVLRLNVKIPGSFLSGSEKPATTFKEAQLPEWGDNPVGRKRLDGGAMRSHTCVWDLPGLSSPTQVPDGCSWVSNSQPTARGAEGPPSQELPGFLTPKSWGIINHCCFRH